MRMRRFFRSTSGYNAGSDPRLCEGDQVCFDDDALKRGVRYNREGLLEQGSGTTLGLGFFLYKLEKADRLSSKTRCARFCSS